MERIGIFGGTFNPPHIGHIHAVKQAIEALNLQKVFLVPDCIAPHKTMAPGSPTPEERLEMLKIAIGGDPRLEACDIELKRGGVSYTADTVASLKERYPDSQLVLLMGTDMFSCFRQWRNWESIAETVVIGVMCRGGKGEEAAIQAAGQELEARGVRVELIRNDAVTISSTQMRRLLAFRCGDDFLPAGVGDYIREKGLYDGGADWKNLPMEELERVVIRLLNPNRVAHVLGCRDTAVDLARCWGADVTDAARAGILHDITKAIDGPLQLTLCAAYGKILSDFSRRYPKTLHALTGSLVAERIFGENPAVVNAIRYHTTGRADMNTLEKIIYVADYMEPNRNFPGVERLRSLAYEDLTGALKLGLEMTMDHLKEQGSETSPESKEALDFLDGYISQI